MALITVYEVTLQRVHEAGDYATQNDVNAAHNAINTIQTNKNVMSRMELQHQ
jgi:hypothetical protein